MDKTTIIEQSGEQLSSGKLARGKITRLPYQSWSIRILSVIVLLAIWKLISSFYPPTLLPGPDLVAVRIGELILEGDFFVHVYHTVARVFVGFALALFTSIFLGIAMGTSVHLENFLDTYVLVGLTIPGLSWALIALMFFGITEIAPVFAIFVVTSPMITVNMWQGTKAIDKELLEMGKAFRAERSALVREIIIPQLLPHIFAATRFGFALAWKVVVLSEMFGLSNGVGYMINQSFSVFSMVSVLAWTVAFTVVMFLFEFGVLKPIEKHFTRWRPAITL
ncbi:MAG: ABC transporter permease [Chloroflexi bacterium]|nr:ABC transporter permease [Chloroflexota bacterium]